ncbi:hypothetical protein TNIN_372821 [Trichonephila inaurata madagascariensis]|uniref:Uncharacterized protein n=1 Tax=Trichonephila inaurata madagascariensis TaxID=2747483 RepID=A0A8X6WT21_9ARAC|nr:hypothetical protein TNIN_372821 [Trichonephila inaurata madagascariensis]
MLTGFRARSSVLQTPYIGPPTSAGNDTSRKVSPPPFCSSMFAFQHLSSHFGALTPHNICFRTGSRMCVDIQTHINPFTEQRKECKPCQRVR